MRLICLFFGLCIFDIGIDEVEYVNEVVVDYVYIWIEILKVVMGWIGGFYFMMFYILRELLKDW